MKLKENNELEYIFWKLRKRKKQYPEACQSIDKAVMTLCNEHTKASLEVSKWKYRGNKEREQLAKEQYESIDRTLGLIAKIVEKM